MHVQNLTKDWKSPIDSKNPVMNAVNFLASINGENPLKTVLQQCTQMNKHCNKNCNFWKKLGKKVKQQKCKKITENGDEWNNKLLGCSRSIMARKAKISIYLIQRKAEFCYWFFFFSKKWLLMFQNCSMVRVSPIYF